MKITHLLPLALTLTSSSHAATSLKDTALSLFKTSAAAKLSSRNSTPPKPTPTFQLSPLDKYIRRHEAFTFTNEEVNSKSQARLYHVTTPSLPENITIPTPLLSVDDKSELYELLSKSYAAFEREKLKSPEEKRQEREERERKMREFRVMNDCFSAFGEQKYCLGGVRELRDLGWEGYAKKFNGLYEELKSKMEEAGRVDLGEKIDAEIQEMWRDAREGRKWNETEWLRKWDEEHNMTGNWSENLTGNWTSSRTSNWTVEGWMREWDERRNLTGNRTSYPGINWTG